MSQGTRIAETPILDRDTADRGPPIAPPILTIVIPTLNERNNIEPLVALLMSTLPDVAWEAIFVDDDSRDGTSDHVRGPSRASIREYGVCNGSAVAAWLPLVSRACLLRLRPM